MERLVDALARSVSRPLSDPFAPEWIAVASPGMERWLSMQLSLRLGVWANPEFPFPRRLLEKLFVAVLGERDASIAAYDPTCMTFGLASLLATHAGRPELAPVAHYLEGDDHARLRVALAGRLADLFDQYATYRPELVLDWQRGREAHFQALLFRAYAEQHGAGHVAARAEQFLHALRNDPEARKRLPERVTVFGISTLPPLYLDLLGALSQHIDVSLFLLSPTREYYADLRSRAQLDAAHLSDAELDALHLEPGHPLLASLGRHGRELSEVLEERTQYMEVPDDLYEEPGEDTLLHRLQSDMLALRDRGHAPDAPRLPIAPGDDSLAIHACHGAMREVEVLHDQLVALLSQQGIEPHDVIVMTPDIEAYAPVIDAVFAENPGRARIPFRIADRGALRSFEVVTALDAILDTLGGRMGVNQVLDLLGMEVIRARFAITADEVETARSLCAQSGVRWGIDASHRHEVEQPEREENTWRFGLARLALGYALPADGDALCLDRAPCAIDSAQGELFGKLSELCETLFALHTELREPCSLPEWQARITRVLGALISEDASTADERKLCQRAMQNLVEHAARAGFAEPIGLATLRAELGDALDERSPAQAFLAGGVTFCQLVPMRSIPFRAVCLLGMNDGAFPASDAPLGFDKIAEKPRKGDRSRRNDDRQLFLEAILSARDKLLITYAGQSIHDGKPLPPSVLVSELIDHVARGFVLPGEPAGGLLEHTRRVEARLVVRHALAAFSPRYFGAEQDPRFFSFARGQYGGAKALLAPRTQAPAFFTRRTASEPTPVREIALADLESFVEHPTRWFVRRRLDVPLGDDALLLSDREPFSLNHLEQWQLGTELLGRARRGQSEDAWPVLRARGSLPIGTPGKLEYQEVGAKARALSEAGDRLRGGAKLPPRRFAITIGDVLLHGSLGELWLDAQVRVQYSKVGRRHELRQWLRHLVLCYLRAREKKSLLPRKSVLIGRNPDPKKEGVTRVTFAPVDGPERELSALVAMFLAGQDALVPLFEHSSRAYCDLLRKEGTTREQALEKARSKFSAAGHAFDRNVDFDTFDDYVSTAYAGWDAVLALREPYDFERAAKTVYAPMLAHRELV